MLSLPNTVPADIDSFEIQGFLKFDNDAQPVIKLENRLKVKVTAKTCDQVVPVAVPACANNDESPFEAEG